MPSQTGTEEDSTAGVILAAPWRVHAVSVLPNHRLAVTFRDGRAGILDCSAIRQPGDHGIFAPLENIEFFAAVRIELGALNWPNGADLDPALIYQSLGEGKSWSVPGQTTN